MDPFSAALDAIFLAPGSSAASYQIVGADIPVRAIVGQPDQSVNFGDGRTVQASHEVLIRRSEIAMLQAGAIVVVEDREFLRFDGVLTSSLRLVGDGQLDAEGLTWTCSGEPV